MAKAKATRVRPGAPVEQTYLHVGRKAPVGRYGRRRKRREILVVNEKGQPTFVADPMDVDGPEYTRGFMNQVFAPKVPSVPAPVPMDVDPKPKAPKPPKPPSFPKPAHMDVDPKPKAPKPLKPPSVPKPVKMETDAPPAGRVKTAVWNIERQSPVPKAPKAPKAPKPTKMDVDPLHPLNVGDPYHEDPAAKKFHPTDMFMFKAVPAPKPPSVPRHPQARSNPLGKRSLGWDALPNEADAKRMRSALHVSTSTLALPAPRDASRPDAKRKLPKQPKGLKPAKKQKR